MTETLTVINDEAAHRFEIAIEGQTAFAEYSISGHKMTLPHTVVPDDFEGRGVGSQLARAALGVAREKGLKVIPTCPFIAGYIEKHPEWHDLMDDTWRGRLGIG